MTQRFLMSSVSHAEGPEAEDYDDEVDGVGEEHQDIDVSDGAVFWLDEGSEELEHRAVKSDAPTETGKHPIISQQSSGERHLHRPCSTPTC